jgi:pyruvate dehydrogenase E1 component alpha subunit
MDKQKYLDMYYQMVLIRRLEERGAELYQAGKIGGFMHLYIGQEAVSTGLIAARQPQDRVITAYRDHGVAINCGISPNQVMAELLGKATGISKGRGGSMHMADVTKNFWGGHAIVGAHLPLAAGLALGDKYAGRDGVTICMVCENNRYGMGTAVARASAVSDIDQKAEGYGISHGCADGMNLLSVYEASKEAIDKVRAGNGPYLLEIMTYRFRGHSMGDPERYRKQEEVKEWQEQDPIGIFHAFLTTNKKATVKTLDEIDERARTDVEKAVEFAEASPEPALESLFKDIYAEEV